MVMIVSDFLLSRWVLPKMCRSAESKTFGNVCFNCNCNVQVDMLIHVRSSHQRCSIKKGVFRNFTKFTGKHLCQILFFNKVAGRPATLLKKRLWHRCFLLNFVKFLRTPFLPNTSGRLLPKCILGNAQISTIIFVNGKD